EPLDDGRGAALPAQVRPCKLDQVSEPFDVGGAGGIPARVVQPPPLGVPVARAAAKAFDEGGMLPPPACAQGLGEEVVIAVPPPVVVEWDEEEIGVVEPLEGLLTVAPSGEGVAQRARELLQRAGEEEEPPGALGLVLEHLLDEVVQDE